MLKLIGTYDIPEWAICYLVNGDAEGLAEEEIQEIDKFWHSLLDDMGIPKLNDKTKDNE